MGHKLYVANGTRQDIVFNFRAPSKKIMALEIKSGRQAVIDYGFSLDELAPIAAHLEVFGARQANETDRLDTLARLIYQFDRPIPASAIEATHEHNLKALTEISAEEAERSGVAFFAAARHITNGEVRASEVEIVEEGDKRQKPRPDAVNYSVAVDPKVRGRQEGKRRSAAA